MLTNCELVEADFQEKPIESLADKVTGAISDGVSSAESAAVGLVDTTSVPEIESVDAINSYNKLMDSLGTTAVADAYSKIQACLDNNLCPNHDYSSKLSTISGYFSDLKISETDGKLDLNSLSEYTSLDNSLKNNVSSMKSDLESTYTNATDQTAGQVDSFKDNVTELRSVAPTKPSYRGAIGV